MTSEITKLPKFDLAALNAEQKVLVSQLKSFAEAEEVSAVERKTFAYLKGRAANALKATCEHGVFQPLVESIFPENRYRWLRYCMEFAEAVDIGKNAPLKFIPDNRLLKGGELSAEEKEKVSGAIDKVTGEKGIKTVIKDWKKQQARTAKKNEPVDKVKQEQERRANIDAILATTEANLRRVVEMKETDFGGSNFARRSAIAGLAIRYGKKFQKAKPTKATKQ